MILTTNNSKKKSKNFFDNLDLLDKTIVLMKKNEPGITIPEIAKRVGKVRATIDKRLAKPEVKKVLRSFGEDAYNILKKGQADAAKRMLDIGLNEQDARTAVMALKEIIKDVLAERKELDDKRDKKFNPLEYLGKEEIDELIEDE